MQWDLGFKGVGLLLAMSAGFGLAAALIAGWGTTRWLGVIAAATYFAAGILVSEVWFGWATEEDLQPNIDGLSFDEALLLAPLAGIVSIVATRYVTRRLRRHRADESRRPPGAASQHRGV